MDVEQIKAHSETRCGVSREEWYAAMDNIGEKERMQMNDHTPEAGPTFFSHTSSPPDLRFF